LHPREFARKQLRFNSPREQLRLVVHYTAGHSADFSASWLCNPLAKASARLLIGKNAKVIQCVPINVVAWHAGESSWSETGDHTLVGLNNHSIRNAMPSSRLDLIRISAHGVFPGESYSRRKGFFKVDATIIRARE